LKVFRSYAEPSQEAPVARRACGGRSHRRQHILLHDNPAVVARGVELMEHRSEIDRASTELAEQTVTDGREVIPPLRARARRDVARAVLEVHVPDAIAILRQERQRIAAAVRGVACVEAEPEELW